MFGVMRVVQAWLGPRKPPLPPLGAYERGRGESLIESVVGVRQKMSDFLYFLLSVEADWAGHWAGLMIVYLYR